MSSANRPISCCLLVLLTLVLGSGRLDLLAQATEPEASNDKPASPQVVQTRDPRELYEETPLTRAVERGVAFLQKSQLPDGSWLSNYGEEGKNTGIVGLAVLALLASRNEPGRGPYGETIDAGVRFLLQSRKRGMLIREQDTSHGPMYEHGIASLVLGEVVGMLPEGTPGFENLARIHRGAVDLLVRAQNVPKDFVYVGGWRYSPTTDQADLSVTGWQILALRAAQDAGVPVPQKSIERAIGHVKRCAAPQGGFVYDPLQSKKANAAMTGTGILALQLCGEYRSEEALRGGDWLLKNPVEWKTPFVYYSLYYATQAMYQLGEVHWERWRAIPEPLLMEKQNPDGSWALPPNVHEREAGFTYTTALAILALTVEYRCLPIYQR